MKIDKEQRYVFAISGGVDSMLLLYYAKELGIKGVVAHVNYGVRDTAQRDTDLVLEVAKQYGYPVEVHYALPIEQGNFQAVAREVRYRFFMQLAKQFHCSGVLVAHHEDDVLETYLMQRQSKRQCDYYGIKAVTKVQGLTIYRPLLEYSKQAILNLAQTLHIRYFDDESNFKQDYTRNKIRHQQVARLNQTQRQQLLDEIAKKNQEQTKLQQAIKTLDVHEVLRTQLLQKPIELQQAILVKMMKNNNIHNLKMQKIEDITKLLYNEKNWSYTLDAHHTFHHSYGRLFIVSHQEEYQYQIRNLQEGIYGDVQFLKKGTLREGLFVEESELPLTLRNYQPKDRIELSFGSKRLSRWFIDQKIPPNERKRWPVLLNNKGEVIFVVGIGANITHFSYNPNVFMVKW